jgi:hypothetical protein
MTVQLQFRTGENVSQTTIASLGPTLTPRMGSGYGRRVDACLGSSELPLANDWKWPKSAVQVVDRNMWLDDRVRPTLYCPRHELRDLTFSLRCLLVQGLPVAYAATHELRPLWYVDFNCDGLGK